MLRVIELSREDGRVGGQVDWATWYVEMTLDEIKAWLGPPGRTDVGGRWRCRPARTDNEVRDAWIWTPTRPWMSFRPAAARRSSPSRASEPAARS